MPAVGRIAIAVLLAVIGAVMVTSAGSATSTKTRCLQVSQRAVTEITTGLTKYRSERLRAVRAVRSRDFKRIYFISADIQGPGMNERTEIATWASNRIDDYGSVFSVDGYAKRFSDWGDGGHTDAHITMDDDGADQSHACVVAALR